MGRPVAFDQDQVINSVVQLFWERGFEATSMKNVCEATGLQPGSLYAAFGSKRALFLTALDTYFDESMESTQAILTGAAPPMQRIHELFRHIVGDACHKDSRGCMVLNTLLEAPAHDAQLRKRIEKMVQALEYMLKDVLTEAAACGELAVGKDPAVQAKLLVNTICGLRVYGKLQSDNPAMMEMIEGLLATLSPQTA